MRSLRVQLVVFGTACNITGDGALTLMLSGYANKHGIEDESELSAGGLEAKVEE